MLRAVFLLLGLLVATQSVAQSERNKLYFDGAPPWVTQPASTLGAATIDLDFANGRFWPSYTLSRIAVTRASVAEEDGPSGVWYPFSSGQLRYTAKGALIEEARTNSIRNNTMVGAVIGTPGTLPTNWVQTNSTGLSLNVVGTGTDSGVSYIDLSVVGTASAGGNLLRFDTSTGIAATYGQTWAESFFIKLSAGTLANITDYNMIINENASGGSLLLSHVGSSTLFQTTGGLGATRTQFSATLTAPTATQVQPFIQINSSGGAVNATFRIGWPQLERNALINASVAAAAVNAAGSGYGNTLTGTMTWASGGTCATAPVLNVTTTAGGAIATVNSVTNAGSCSVFPTAAATWTPGGGLSAGTSATFTLTPTNNAALAGATSPILTTSAAATRAADVVTMTLPSGAASTSGYSLLVVGTPELPTGYPNNQFLGQLDDGTGNNRLYIDRLAGTANVNVGVVIATVATAIGPGSIAALTAAKISGFASPNSIVGVNNNGNPSSGAPTGLALVSRLVVGANNGPANQFNGYISRVVVAPASLIGN